MESEIKDSGSMLPARMVLEHDDEKGTYWTCLESFTASGGTTVHYRKDFATEAQPVWAAFWLTEVSIWGYSSEISRDMIAALKISVAPSREAKAAKFARLLLVEESDSLN